MNISLRQQIVYGLLAKRLKYLLRKLVRRLVVCLLTEASLYNVICESSAAPTFGHQSIDSKLKVILYGIID